MTRDEADAIMAMSGVLEPSQFQAALATIAEALSDDPQSFAALIGAMERQALLEARQIIGETMEGDMEVPGSWLDRIEAWKQAMSNLDDCVQQLMPHPNPL